MIAPKNCVLTFALFVLITGCASYKKPTHYKCFTEYGCLPVIEGYGSPSIMAIYVAYDWYIHEAGTGGTHIHDVGLIERASLPATKDEAIAIVQKNFKLEKKHQQSEAMKEVAMAPVTVPFTLVYWAPGIAIISEYHAHHASHGGRQQAPAEKSGPATVKGKSNKEKSTKQRINRDIDIQVTDLQGRPIPEAKILKLYSPIPFMAYADEDGHRTFPRQTWIPFHISSALAEVLARYVDEKNSPSSIPVDQGGRTTLPVRYYGDTPGKAAVFVLVKTEGYRPQATRIALDEISSGTLDFKITLKRQVEAEPLDGLNPWVVVKKLGQQIRYYEKEHQRIANPSLDPLPPLPWSEFETLVLAASKVALDHPAVHSARFFYEVEKGRLEEAKKYHRYIQDEIYVRAIYGMNWETGLMMR